MMLMSDLSRSEKIAKADRSRSTKIVSRSQFEIYLTAPPSFQCTLPLLLLLFFLFIVEVVVFSEGGGCGGYMHCALPMLCDLPSLGIVLQSVNTSRESNYDVSDLRAPWQHKEAPEEWRCHRRV